MEVFLGCIYQRRDDAARIKLALEWSRWHSHLGGSHAILTTSVVDIRLLRTDIAKLALDRSRWHSHLGGSHAILAICVVDRGLLVVCDAWLCRSNAS